MKPIEREIERALYFYSGFNFGCNMYAFTGYELAYRFFMVYVNKIEVNVQEMFYYYKILIDKSISIVCMIIAQMKKFVYIMCGDLYVLRVI